MKITCRIDSDLLDRAEEEAFHILLEQRLAFNDRWYTRPSVIKAMSFLRILGLSISVLGALISIVAVTMTPAWCPAWMQFEIFILIFVLAAFLFYYLPSIDRSIKDRVKNISINSCMKLAGKCVKAARNAVPYQAEYEIKGDLISYYRGSNDVWELAWSRRLKGVVIHGESITIFFRKWTSIQPVMIVLHEDFSCIEQVLTDLNIQIKRHGGMVVGQYNQVQKTSYA